MIYYIDLISLSLHYKYVYWSFLTMIFLKASICNYCLNYFHYKISCINNLSYLNWNRNPVDKLISDFADVDSFIFIFRGVLYSFSTLSLFHIYRDWSSFYTVTACASSMVLHTLQSDSHLKRYGSKLTCGNQSNIFKPCGCKEQTRDAFNVRYDY